MSLASMTGFGRARGRLSGRFDGSIVVRAVNHRYLDVQVRTNLREEIPEVEAVVRGVVSAAVARGRVTVQLNFERCAPSAARVMVDEAAVKSAVAQLAGLDLEDGLVRPLELRDVLALPGLVAVLGEETLLDDDETRVLAGVAQEAVDSFVRMRREEGERLGDQIRDEISQLEAFLDWFEERIATIRETLLERLEARLNDLVASRVDLEPERLIQEAAILADRADVAEELVRLRSHLENFGKRLKSSKPVGRALDFLCQEIHRELNTLGSKCRELGVAERLVDAKTATERIREQVQNLE